MTPLVAVIGAGIAGLSAARSLRERGRTVIVFDKGRGPGGRTSARRTEQGYFDHGAQYFTARDQTFQDSVARWQKGGLVTAWSPRLIRTDGAEPPQRTRFLPQPAMNALARHLAGDLDVRSGVRITAVERQDRRWTLHTAAGERFAADRVIVALPAPQIPTLVAQLDNHILERLAAVTFAPCWAVLAASQQPQLDPGFDGAFISDGPLSWVCRQGGKAGRAGAGWVLHASPDWSERWIDAPTEDVEQRLLNEFKARFSMTLTSSAAAHRWRYARVSRPAGAPCLIDATTGLVLSGDWCTGARVEDAYRSGVAAAEAVWSGGDHGQR